MEARGKDDELLRKALARIELLEGKLAEQDVPPKAPNALNGKPKDDEEDPPIVCPDGTAVLCHKDLGFELNLNKGSQIDPLLVFLLKNANQKYIYFIKNKLFLKQLVFELRCWVPMRFA